MKDTTVITPNRRLAATFLKKYNAHLKTLSHPSWETLDILPFARWIERLWHDYSAQHFLISPRLLTAQQEILIWEEIIKKSTESEILLSLTKTCTVVKSAWGVLKQWQIPLNHPLLGVTEDSLIFLKWAKEFEKVCEQNNWLDENSLVAIMLNHFQNKQITCSPNLLLVGFTECTPLQQKLFDTLKNLKINLQYLPNIGEYFVDKNKPLSLPLKKISKIALSDEESEILTMARWAKSWVDQSLAFKQPLTIGCIIPHLERVRETVIRLFTEVFAENNSLLCESNTKFFNISVGKRLHTFPVVHTALELLKLNNEIKLADLSHILRSPFIGEAESELLKRAEFDALLKKSQYGNIHLSTLLDAEEKINLKKYCPRLASRLGYFLTEKNHHNYTTIKEWASHFIHLLNIVGWPGERSLNSHEYQIVQQFLDTLQEFANCNSLFPNVHFDKALNYLQKFVNNAIYQPQSPEAPLQILGVLEGAGLPFDAVWVMGVNDRQFPAPVKPNPFIPHRLQKLLHMPHATVERELKYTQELMNQIIQNANEVIFSYAEKSADCELQASAMIQSFENITVASLTLSNFIPCDKIAFTHRKIEFYEDHQAPPLQPFENIHTGISLFKNQAACPFKAFAEIRLSAKPLTTSRRSMHNKIRGIIFHKALELIWNHLQDSSSLAKLEDTELTNLISHFVQKAFLETPGINFFSKAYLQLELKRQTKLIYKWLMLEKTRPAFKVISHEIEHEILIGNLPITLRIDRIDELADGTQVIIDYKTHHYNSIHHWFNERPEEPQLPLYTLIAPERTVAIAYAEIHAKNIGFKGVSHKSIDINNIKPIASLPLAEERRWDEQIVYWRKTLEKIAYDFSNGHALVNPKNSLETCRLCQLQPLCRIHDI